MKVTVDGFEVEGTEDEILRLVKAIRQDQNGSDTLGFDSSVLTPKQREVFEVVAKHPNGIHVSLVAKEANIDVGVANSRLNYLCKNYPDIIHRTFRGTFISNFVEVSR